MKIKSSKKEKLQGIFSSVGAKIAMIFVVLAGLVGGGIGVYFALADSATGENVLIGKQDDIRLYFGKDGNNAYTYRYLVQYVDGEKAGIAEEAMCLEPEEKTPAGEEVGVFNMENETVKKILLVSPLGDAFGAGTAKYDWTGSSQGHDWSRYGSDFALAHSLIGYAYDHDDFTGFSSSWKSTFDERIDEILALFEDDSNLQAIADSVVLKRSKNLERKQIVVWLENDEVPEPEPVQFEVGVQKSSSDPDMTDGVSEYSLSGAEFQICRRVRCPAGSVIGTVTVPDPTSDGKTNTITLEAGIYYIMETKAPTGYRKPNYDEFDNDELAALTSIAIYDGMAGGGRVIVDGNTVWYETQDDPIVGGVKIKKVDAETMEVEAIGGASLAGAKIRITNTDTHENPSCNNGQDAGIAIVGNNGYAECTGLVPGNYQAREIEVRSDSGYLLNNTDSVSFSVAAGSSEVIEGGVIKNQIKRGDVEFVKILQDYECKIDEETPCSERLENIPFVIESLDTGEKHVIITDRNGVLNTATISHTTNTNENDWLITGSGENVSIETDSRVKNAGVWFKGYTGSGNGTPKNDKGALPYGRYKIYELRVKENEFWKLIDGDDAIEFMIEENGVVFDLGEVIDELIDNPELGTTATAENGTDKIDIGEKVKIKDTIEYSGLVEGKAYNLVVELVDRERSLDEDTYESVEVYDGGGGKVSSLGIDKDINGNALVAGSGGSGTWTIAFETDTSELVGKELTVFEELYRGDILVGVHKKLLDEEGDKQTVEVKVPEIISTEASRKVDNSKRLKIGEDEVIDKVEIKGLVSGEKYTLTGRIEDTKTGTVLKTKELVDQTYTGETGSSVTITVDFGKIDTTSYVSDSDREKRLVVIQELTFGGEKVSTHPEKTDGNWNINDPAVSAEMLSLEAPAITTTAYDGESGNVSDKEVKIASNAVIKDKVEYSGLADGTEFLLSGKVVLHDNPETVLSRVDNQPVVVGEEWIMTFDVDTVRYAGKKLVVYEYLTKNEVEVAKHENKEAPEQQIDVTSVSLSTQAWVGSEGVKHVGVGSNITVSDTVSYTGLVSGEEYKLRSELVLVKEEGGVVSQDGEVISDRMVPFTVDASGKTTITFENIDTRRYIGRKLVVRETLYPKTATVADDNYIARHIELDNNNQTINIDTPEIMTTARNADNRESQDVGVGKVKVVDYVKYSNLIIGERYWLKADIRKADGTSILSGDEEFIAVADGQNNPVEVRLFNDEGKRLNTVDLSEQTLYITEILYSGELGNPSESVEITRHEEASDVEQQIHVKNKMLTTEAKSGTIVEGNGDKVVGLSESAEIIDKSTYRGLAMGNKYKIVGVLMEQKVGEDGAKTAEPLLINGNTITAEEIFTVGEGEKGEDGEAELTFTLDTRDIPGKNIVVYETLYLLNSDDSVDLEVISHKNPESTEQWIEVQPKVGTKVVDKVDNDQAVGVGKVNVIDTVSYSGLKVGTRYLLRGVMMDKETGETLPQTIPYNIVESFDEEIRFSGGKSLYVSGGKVVNNSSSVEGYTIFTIGEEGYEGIDGEAKVEFELETDQLQGKELVVFEELYEIKEAEAGKSDGILRTEHKDLEDEAQSIIVKNAGIGTTATDRSDGDKELDLTEDAEVIDAVDYYGLVPGVKYKLIGLLVDKETGNGIGVQTEKEFIAKGENGLEEILFNVNTKDLSGKELVAYETLYYINEEEKEVKIAEHKDLEDQKQTVWVKVFTPNTGIFGAISDGGAVKKISFVALAIGALGAVYSVLLRKRKIRF